MAFLKTSTRLTFVPLVSSKFLLFFQFVARLRFHRTVCIAYKYNIYQLLFKKERRRNLLHTITKCDRCTEQSGNSSRMHSLGDIYVKNNLFFLFNLIVIVHISVAWLAGSQIRYECLFRSEHFPLQQLLSVISGQLHTKI